MCNLKCLAVAGALLLPTWCLAQPEVAKLIEQLSDRRFRARQQAADELVKFGRPVLPALQKAARATSDPEVKRRVELLVSRIENAEFHAEEERWVKLHDGQRAVKERLFKILDRTPNLSDEQLARSVYLLTVGRPPADEELKSALKQFAEAERRTVHLLQLTRTLLQGKECKTAVVDTNLTLLNLQKELAAEKRQAELIARVTGPEFQKSCGAIAAALDKVVKSEEQYVTLVMLLALSRFPTANEMNGSTAYLKQAQQRAAAAADIVWAVLNTNEFLKGQ